MVGRSGIDELQLRKRALLLESELNRLGMAAEWRNVRAATAWVGEAAEAWHQFKPWLVLLAPVGGVFVGLGGRRPVGVVNRIFRIWRWARMLRSVWNRMAGGAASST